MDVYVIPSSKKFEILRKKDGKGLLVRVRNKPERGKANIELIKEFRKIFGCEVMIKSGLSSRRKVLELDIPVSDFERILQKLGI